MPPVMTPDAQNAMQPGVGTAVPAGMIPTASAASSAAGTPATDDPRNRKGLSSGMVMLILTLGTTAVAFADRYLNNNLTWYTGVTFVALCTICALFVRRTDRWMAVFWPPLAFLLALMISGQPEVLGANGNLLIREASLLFSGLAFNAPWIFGGTILALLIVIVRRPIKD